MRRFVAEAVAAEFDDGPLDDDGRWDPSTPAGTPADPVA